MVARIRLWLLHHVLLTTLLLRHLGILFQGLLLWVDLFVLGLLLGQLGALLLAALRQALAHPGLHLQLVQLGAQFSIRFATLQDVGNVDIVDIALGRQLAARPAIRFRGGFRIVKNGMTLVATATPPARLAIVVLDATSSPGTGTPTLALLAIGVQTLLIGDSTMQLLVLVIAQVIIGHQTGGSIAHMQMVIAQVEGIRIDNGRMILARMAGGRLHELHIRGGEVLGQVDLSRFELGQRLLRGRFRLDNREANIRSPAARRGIWKKVDNNST